MPSGKKGGGKLRGWFGTWIVAEGDGPTLGSYGGKS